MKKILVLVLCIVMAFTFAACDRPAEITEPPATLLLATPEPEADEEPIEWVDDGTLDSAIIKIVDDRLTALETEDYDLYMSAIGQNNQFYFNEQERWFMNMIDESISNIELSVHDEVRTTS